MQKTLDGIIHALPGLPSFFTMITRSIGSPKE
jgi:hypothetical protein